MASLKPSSTARTAGRGQLGVSCVVPRRGVDGAPRVADAPVTVAFPPSGAAAPGPGPSASAGDPSGAGSAEENHTVLPGRSWRISMPHASASISTMCRPRPCGASPVGSCGTG